MVKRRKAVPRTARSAARKLAGRKRASTRRMPKRAARRASKLRAALPWRVAYSLDNVSGLRAQVDKRVPGRSISSDGSIGDAAHQSRTSDHNAWRRVAGQPVVGAIDITHDPRGGFDSYHFARTLVKDPRNWPYLKYVISNGEIWTVKTKKWTHYNGSNPHDHHVHVSVPDEAKYFDAKPTYYFEVKPGNAMPDGTVPGDRPAPVVPAPDQEPILRRGSKGDLVRVWQRIIGVKDDGDFGPATERATKAFQTSRGLTADGVVGPQSWRAGKAAKVAAPATPAATPPASSEQRVKEYVIEDEGGLTIHSDEPGGASNYGISIDTLSVELGRRATLDDLRALTPDAAWAIYQKKFWPKMSLPSGLDYAAFDFAVNSGPAVVDGDDANDPPNVDDFLKQVLDGGGTVAQQIDKLCDLRLRYMQSNPRKWARYKNGWQARVSRVRSRSKQMAA